MGIIASVFRSRRLITLLACACSACSQQSRPAEKAHVKQVSDPNQVQIGTELNRMRADPTAYASELERRRQFYSGNVLQIPGQVGIVTKEGVAALDEAVQALKSSPPLP